MSREVIFPGQGEHPLLFLRTAALCPDHMTSCPTLKVLVCGETLVRWHRRSLFDGDSSRHADETRLEICRFGKVWLQITTY